MYHHFQLPALVFSCKCPLRLLLAQVAPVNFLSASQAPVAPSFEQKLLLEQQNSYLIQIKFTLNANLFLQSGDYQLPDHSIHNKVCVEGCPWE